MDDASLFLALGVELPLLSGLGGRFGDCPPPLLRLGLSSFFEDLCSPPEPEITRRGFSELDRELDPDEELPGLLLRLSRILTLRPSTRRLVLPVARLGD